MQFTSSFSPIDPTSRPAASVFNLVSNANRDGPSGWLQIPPTHMPWGTPAAHQPNIVRFTAEPLDKPTAVGLSAAAFGQCKRKIEPELEFVRSAGVVHDPPLPGVRCLRGDRRRVLVKDMLRPAAKQLITEEKMAAHMRQLHISNSYTSHDEPVVNAMANNVVQSEPETTLVAPTIPAEERAYKRLVLCEEIRHLQNEPLLPPSLLSQMQRPTMALVLWQPPSGRMSDALSEAAAAAASAEDEAQKQARNNRYGLQQMNSPFPSVSSDNNNSSSAINLNAMHRFTEGLFQSSEPQAMDL